MPSSLLTSSRCDSGKRHPAAITDDSVLVELIVMDRPPEAFTAAGARNTTDEGDLARLIWVVEIAVEGQCCVP